MTKAEIKKLIEEKVLEIMILANEVYEKDFPLPELEWKLTGRTAGNCRIPPAHNYPPNKMPRNKKRIGWINFNLEIAKHNLEAFLKRTVRHEISHLIDCYLYGRTRPHGRNWEMVMWKLGDKNPTRCHSYDMSNVKVRRLKKRYLYACDCDELHSLTIIRHRRIQNEGKKFGCRTCRKRLEYTGRMEDRGN